MIKTSFFIDKVAKYTSYLLCGTAGVSVTKMLYDFTQGEFFVSNVVYTLILLPAGFSFYYFSKNDLQDTKSLSEPYFVVLMSITNIKMLSSIMKMN